MKIFDFWNTLEFPVRRRLIRRSYVTNWVTNVGKIRVRVTRNSNQITGLERRPEAMQCRVVSKRVCTNCRGMCELRDQIGVRVGVGVRDLWRSYVSERGLRERAKYPKQRQPTSDSKQTQPRDNRRHKSGEWVHEAVTRMRPKMR